MVRGRGSGNPVTEDTGRQSTNPFDDNYQEPGNSAPDDATIIETIETNPFSSESENDKNFSRNNNLFEGSHNLEPRATSSSDCSSDNGSDNGAGGNSMKLPLLLDSGDDANYEFELQDDFSKRNSRNGNAMRKTITRAKPLGYCSQYGDGLSPMLTVREQFDLIAQMAECRIQASSEVSRDSVLRKFLANERIKEERERILGGLGLMLVAGKTGNSSVEDCFGNHSESEKKRKKRKKNRNHMFGNSLGANSSSSDASPESSPLSDPGLENRLVATLTPGQRRLLNIAIAFVGNPAVVILDEPTGDLSLDERNRLFSFLRQESKKRGTGILISSHDCAETEELADRVAFLRNGILVSASGSVNELKEKFECGYKILMSLNSEYFADRIRREKRAREVEKEEKNNFKAGSLANSMAMRNNFERFAWGGSPNPNLHEKKKSSFLLRESLIAASHGIPMADIAKLLQNEVFPEVVH